MSTFGQMDAVSLSAQPWADYARLVAGAVPTWQAGLSWALIGAGSALLTGMLLPVVRRHVMPAQAETFLADLLPFNNMLQGGDGIACKDGTLTVAVEISGIDLSSADSHERAIKRLRRQEFWTDADPDVFVRVFQWKQRVDLADSVGEWSSERVEAIGQAWFDQFAGVYVVRHVVVLSIGSASERAKARLEHARDRVLEHLHPFGPRILGNGADGESDLLSFWAWVVNPANPGRVAGPTGLRRKRFDRDGLERAGASSELIRTLEAKGTLSQGLNKRLVGGTVEVEPEGLVSYAGGGGQKYGHWVAIPVWSDGTTERLVSELLQIDGEICLLHRVQPLSADSAARMVNDAAANAQADRDDMAVEAQAALARQRLSPASQDKQGVALYELAVLALGRTPEEASRVVRRVCQVQREFLMRPAVAESDDAQELYFGQFPSYNAMRRDCGMFSSNLADVISFESVTEGLPECDWFPEPVALFKTLQGTVFRFCPHEAVGKEKLAHVVVIGQPGSGKSKLGQLFTTLASRIPGFRATVLDRDYQNFPWAMVNGAQYYGLHGDMPGLRGAKLNPLQLDLNDPDNVEHLRQWFSLLTNLSDAESLEIFGRAIEFTRLLDADQRSLDIVVSTIFPGSSRAYAAIHKWIDENQRGAVFARGREHFSIDARISVFNMTKILDDEVLAPPVVADLWHRHRAAVKAAGVPPNLFWIDEARALLPNAFMRELVVRELREKRRQRESVWLLFQEPTAPAEFGPEFMATIRGSCPTKILFPIEGSKANDWLHWELTDRELRFLTGEATVNLRYPALVKQPNVSVIVELDQAPLGDAERFFRGGGEFVRAAFDARAAHSDLNEACEEYLRLVQHIERGAYRARKHRRVAAGS